ncbi:MAG: tetratricopeptide repeat protein [Ginsengibacter sp.]
MRKIVAILFLFIFLFQKKTFAQFYKQLDSLCVMCDRSISESQKVLSLGKLANFYYIFKLNAKGDSVLHEQILVAELSNDSALILQALFGEAILNIGPSASKESFDKTIQFIQRGIDFAKTNNKYDYLALGYTRMSEVLRKRGEYDKAFYNAITALSLLNNVVSDSVKSITYIELGDTYLSKGDPVSACRQYNSAFDIAVKQNIVSVQSKIHHCLSEMYRNLDDSEHAVEELNHSFILNKQHGSMQGVLEDYYDLARITNEKFFIQKSIALADSLHDYKHLIYAKRLMLVYYYVVDKNDQLSLQYLQNDPDLQLIFSNDGAENYYMTLGNIYFYPGKIDSALFYYNKAQTDLDNKFDRNLSRINMEQIAECYSLQNKYTEAISYFQKALAISMQMKEFNTISNYSGKLSNLYEKQNNYKNALRYSKQFVVYKDSLRQFAKENDIALLAVQRENNKHQFELLQKTQHEYAKRNIHYMGITITIIVTFFIMLFVGSFPVSLPTVRVMGFFFFISLFEFLVLLLDSFVLSPPFHNQPLILWLIKIGVIALLAPCQHFLERRVIDLLSSKKLIEARTRFSIKKWWMGLKKQPEAGDEGLEKETAVL